MTLLSHNSGKYTKILLSSGRGRLLDRGVYYNKYGIVLYLEFLCANRVACDLGLGLGVACDLGLHCLPVSYVWDTRREWVEPELMKAYF